jgi:hypothetical protein
MRVAAVVSGAGGRYVDWGVLHISVANLVVILVMVAVFVLALVLPFPGDHGEAPGGDGR